MKFVNLDPQICTQARLTRDARFDGKFFIGVRGTRIYCRPICPVPTVKEKNVLYFPTAAAAAESGFRPCLRCRPECSPGTPAWCGTSNTVSRALRLIDEGGLEDAGIEGLAERLGVSPRHLRRLFIQHLGAPPSAVMKTRRLHFAKRLLDETSLPMSEVAFAAGYGCVRRFNDDISKTYKRTPTQLRRQKEVWQDDHYLFSLPFRPPYDWNGLLAFFAHNATLGIEAVNEHKYCRSISLNGSSGYFEVSLSQAQDALLVRLKIPDPRLLYTVIERIRRMFDLNADWSSIAQNLRTDPELALRIEATPGRRVPGCWDAFELTVRAIVDEETDAKACSSRIAGAFGKRSSDLPDGLTHLFPTPQALTKANLESLGLTAKRADAIRSLARAICDGQLSFEQIVGPAAFLSRLREITGIDQGTAEYVAMRALGEPDAFPIRYAGLSRSIDAETADQMEKRAELWRPWRSYAAVYLTAEP